MFDPGQLVRKFDENYTLYHELMSFKVREILLVSSPYDAFVLEEDGDLAQRIINEYHGLNLSAPPRLTHVATVEEALEFIQKRKFDLVLCMPYIGHMDAFSLGKKIKEVRPRLPVILLTPNLHCIESASQKDTTGIDRIYIWTGDSSLLLALIKNLEDHVNVKADTKAAMVRVLILVDDSPEYTSSFLPLLYRAVVRQTQSVLEESFNDEHRLLKMRARPKILLASNYEEAKKLINRFKQYVLCVMSDTRFPRNKVMDDEAGIRLLKYVRNKTHDMPLLLMSSEAFNESRAKQIPSMFADKNSPDLQQVIENFFVEHLGFGDFVFRNKERQEVGRAANFKEFDQIVKTVPEESLLYHARRNHFSNWIMARSEVGLATILSTINTDDFSSAADMRRFLSDCIYALRKWRHQGIVAKFDNNDFDPDVVEIVKMGQGSMGGKARGIAFLSSLLHKRQDLREKFNGFPIKVPKTLVIASDGFNQFVEENKLFYLCGGRDQIISKRFLNSKLPVWLTDSLRAFLQKVDCPLAVRSSSMHEDAQYRPYAGLYKTVMLPNDHPDFKVRFKHIQDAVKLVYASAYFENPRSYAKSIGQSRLDSMAVIVQQLIGQQSENHFYPAVSGVAQSYNYYPISYMKPEDGIVFMALGFGKTVVEGEKCLRFSPQFPKVLPQFATVESTLKNTQRYFYALDMASDNFNDFSSLQNLVKLEISEAKQSHAINSVCSTYIENEHRIRDIISSGPKVVTFAQMLKFKTFPLTDIVNEMLEICEEGLGCPVEIEFAIDLIGGDKKDKFYLLQVRPLVLGFEKEEVRITDSDVKKAFCYSKQTLGHGIISDINDIILVKKESFSQSNTRTIAQEIGKFNAMLCGKNKKYILAGPGRWGSADPLLGIPVQWHDISGVGAIIELVDDLLKVDPSQGTHFFQNITSLNIFYMTIGSNKRSDNFNWQTLNDLSVVNESDHVVHLHSETPFIIKVDGNNRCGIISTEKLF